MIEQREGVVTDSMTMPSVLGACGHEGDLLRGKAIHSWVSKNGYFSNFVVANVLINMNSICGFLDGAKGVFLGVTKKAMIACYGFHGMGNDALALFNKMQAVGVMPNSLTFTAILSNCGRSEMHNNVEVGDHAARWLFEYEGANSSNYVVLSSIYAAVERKPDVSNTRSRMREMGLTKTTSCS
ncbi:hypothetical protein AMTR_s00088p00113900 [Amborella trichopoda]|uniref:Pentatricopeptide repeat-containing protein n=1 Tax=Amborella trichopoda TaxID=13333 RepID=W1NVB7_AMBTC|nr:hypothetical protein AMTR_s00088p00113900 [Amborella trichopoda]